MGLDLPDGTKKITIAYTGGFVGLEELAYRIRYEGVVPYNLLGNCFMIEDWLDTADNWALTQSGLGSVAQLSDTYWMSNANVLELTAGNVASAYARAIRLLPYLGAKKYGFCCGIAHNNSAGGEFTFEVDFITPTQIIEAFIKVSPKTGGVYLYNGAGVWTKIHSQAQTYWTVKLFNLLLFTVDLDSGYYDKLIWNDTEYDISAYMPVTAVAAQAVQAIRIRLQNSAYGASGCTCYVDNICASRNVP